MTDTGAHGALDQLIHGEVIDAADPRYDETRTVFNAMVDIRPRLIVRCADVGDVAAAVRYAVDNDIEIGIRGGGHSVAGACLAEDGLVVDLRDMRSVTVDAGALTATVAGGATWSDVDRATQPHGLAMTGGRVSSTGVGGLTLGGGSGWLERRFGMACDHLVSAELVTATGERIVVDDRRHPDLFWALHGGGGNFGIVTSFTFRLERLPEFSVALLLWPGVDGRTVARTYREFAATAPDEIGGAFLYLTGPPEEFVPAELSGALCCAALVTCVGPESALRAHLGPLLELAPAGAVIAEMPYADAQCMIDDPAGLRNHWTGEYLDDLPDAALDAFCAAEERMIVPSNTQHLLVPWGGRVASGADSGPMRSRDARWVVHPFGMWSDPADDERGRAWARDAAACMRPWATGATYLNFVADEGEERIVASFGRENHRRLAGIKADYDPDNVFHRWHNVRPEKPVAAG